MSSRMSSVSVFCCLRGCLDNFQFRHTVPHVPKENPVLLDTAFMGYEVVVVKNGLRVCGSGAVLGSAPLVQSKAYFEVKIQQGGSWSVGIATRQTDLSSVQGGQDEYSWSLSNDCIIYHNKQEIQKFSLPATSNEEIEQINEGDIIGVAFDHIQLKFFINGSEIDHSLTNVKGTVYPALHVDDGAILDIVLDNFTYSPPSGFDKIMIEQSLL